MQYATVYLRWHVRIQLKEKKKKRKQSKIGLIYILRIFFLKETKIIPFQTNSKYNDLLQVDIVVFLFIFNPVLFFSYGFL